MASNEIGQRLGDRLHLVFCDLHSKSQLERLAAVTGCEVSELMDALFVTERYRPSSPGQDWPMSRFYEELSDVSGAQSFDLDTFSWQKVPQMLPADAQLSPDDRDFANTLLSSDNLRPVILVGRVGSGKTTFLSRFAKYVAPVVPELAGNVFLHIDFARSDVHGPYASLEDEGKSINGESFDAALDVVRIHVQGQERAAAHRDLAGVHAPRQDPGVVSRPRSKQERLQLRAHHLPSAHSRQEGGDLHRQHRHVADGKAEAAHQYRPV
jgi:hypothetical protein